MPIDIQRDESSFSVIIVVVVTILLVVVVSPFGGLVNATTITTAGASLSSAGCRR
jgi:hypothetical protein